MKKRVLVVEDEPDRQDQYASFLDFRGVLVDRASSAEEARRCLGGFVYDLVLLDLKIGEHIESGFGVLEWMMTNDRTIPTVVVSMVVELPPYIVRLKQFPFVKERIHPEKFKDLGIIIDQLLREPLKDETKNKAPVKDNNREDKLPLEDDENPLRKPPPPDNDNSPPGLLFRAAAGVLAGALFLLLCWFALLYLLKDAPEMAMIVFFVVVILSLAVVLLYIFKSKIFQRAADFLLKVVKSAAPPHGG